MERMWFRRLRWRLRGAWMLPLFVVLTPLEGVLLTQLPLSGTGTPLLGGILLAGFFNLVAIAGVAPVAGRLLRRRRPDLPVAIATDYAGAALLGVVLAGLVAGGLANRDAAAEQERDFAAQATAAQRWIAERAPEPYRSNVHSLGSIELEEDYWRACVPGDRPNRAFCLLVSTDQSPPGVKVDPSRAPNAQLQPYGP